MLLEQPDTLQMRLQISSELTTLDLQGCFHNHYLLTFFIYTYVISTMHTNRISSDHYDFASKVVHACPVPTFFTELLLLYLNKYSKYVSDKKAFAYIRKACNSIVTSEEKWSGSRCILVHQLIKPCQLPSSVISQVYVTLLGLLTYIHTYIQVIYNAHNVKQNG